jgi:hypothetical protein
MDGGEPERDRNFLNDNLRAIKGEVIWPPLFLLVLFEDEIDLALHFTHCRA